MRRPHAQIPLTDTFISGPAPGCKKFFPFLRTIAAAIYPASVWKVSFRASMKFRALPPDQHYGFKSLCKFQVLEVLV